MMNTATAVLTCFFTQRLPFLTRTVRVRYRSIRATWRAGGNRWEMCAGAAVTWMVRRSRRPCPFSSVTCLTGTDAQSSASSSAHSAGVFCFTVNTKCARSSPQMNLACALTVWPASAVMTCPASG
jgi:hypothetical protein